MTGNKFETAQASLRCSKGIVKPPPPVRPSSPDRVRLSKTPLCRSKGIVKSPSPVGPNSPRRDPGQAPLRCSKGIAKSPSPVRPSSPDRVRLSKTLLCRSKGIVKSPSPVRPSSPSRIRLNALRLLTLLLLLSTLAVPALAQDGVTFTAEVDRTTLYRPTADADADRVRGL